MSLPDPPVFRAGDNVDWAAWYMVGVEDQPWQWVAYRRTFPVREVSGRASSGEEAEAKARQAYREMAA